MILIGRCGIQGGIQVTEQKIGELFRQYEKYVLTVILSRLYDGCPKDYAYDCLQDVFAIALEKKDDEKFNQNPIGWLTLTAQHVVENYNRKFTNRSRFHHTAFDFDLNTVPASDYWFEDMAYRVAIENHIWERILDDLKRDERVIFIMRYYQEMSSEDICLELGISKNHLAVRLSRIKHKVKKAIKKYVGA